VLLVRARRGRRRRLGEDFWDRTNRQDWAACESVQRGLGSPHLPAGTVGPNEDAVYQWVTLIGRAYLGHATVESLRSDLLHHVRREPPCRLPDPR